MKAGKKISTSLGEVILLDVQEKYLVLFNEKKGEFIKANGYQKDSDGKIFWNSGEYYSSLNELIKNLY